MSKLEDAYREGYEDCYNLYLPIIAAIVYNNNRELIVDTEVLRHAPAHPQMEFFIDEPTAGKIRITIENH